jgi:DNA-binding winged helix-turn-helix (wHTH) protein
MRYAFADCELDTEAQSLFRDGRPVAVEPQVFDLLRLLVENADRLVTKDEIIDTVWQGRIVSDSAISARIASARKAVGCDGKTQSVIATVARRGLRLVAAVTTETAPQPASYPTQQIRYTTNARGHALAYAVTGSGPPLVRMGHNHTHLEEEWNTQTDQNDFQAIAARHSLIRFDIAGTGLSEPEPVEIDFDAMADDIVTVAQAAGHDRFALYSQSGGVHSAVRAAARHPGKISRLVIMGGYCDGRMRRTANPEPDAMRAIMAESWRAQTGIIPAYMMAYFPEGPMEAIQEYVRVTQASATREQALRIRDASNQTSLAKVLPLVRCPTLILHARHDGVHPLAEAQKLAAGIPDARLVVLETANLMPIKGQPEWPRMMQTMLDFLAEDGPERSQGAPA